MPSKDMFHARKPELNDSIAEELSSAPARPQGTSAPGRGRGVSRTERPAPGAAVQRLARSLGKDVEELAGKIPADTLRRTRYPVIEQRDEHGRIVFKDDIAIREGRTALHPTAPRRA